MFTGSPIFVRVRGYGQRAARGGSWLILAPGLMLTLMALAILVWPELLAYMVASVMLFAGLSLSIWGWSMRRAERKAGERVISYERF